MLCITSPWLTYFITGGMCLLLPFTYFAPSTPACWVFFYHTDCSFSVSFTNSLASF